MFPKSPTKRATPYRNSFNNQSKFTGIILIIILLSNGSTFSQTDRASTEVWSLAGVTYKESEKIKISLQYGINNKQSVKAIYTQAFIQTSKYVTLNPAYLYLNTSISGTQRLEEHTFMNAIILSLPLKNIVIDDRNLIWNRFRKNADDYHYYRNRFRITKLIKYKLREIRLYAFDEVWLFINKGKSTRNRIGIGFSSDLTTWSNMDISFARQSDITSGSTNLFFLMGTVQLTNNENK